MRYMEQTETRETFVEASVALTFEAKKNGSGAEENTYEVRPLDLERHWLCGALERTTSNGGGHIQMLGGGFEGGLATSASPR